MFIRSLVGKSMKIGSSWLNSDCVWLRLCVFWTIFVLRIDLKTSKVQRQTGNPDLGARKGVFHRTLKDLTPMLCLGFQRTRHISQKLVPKKELKIWNHPENHPNSNKKQYWGSFFLQKPAKTLRKGKRKQHPQAYRSLWMHKGYIKESVAWHCTTGHRVLFARDGILQTQNCSQNLHQVTTVHLTSF